MGGLEFSLIGWVCLVSPALSVGIARPSICWLGALAVAGFAMFIPARESTAAVLLILIIGDLVSVGLYRRSADWSMLRRLLPAVLPGIAPGAVGRASIEDRHITGRQAGDILRGYGAAKEMRAR